MNKRLIAGLSVLALFAVVDVAAAQKSGGALGPRPAQSPGKEGGANMGAGNESPGASERESSPGSPSERGTSSEKGAASEQRSDKGTDKGASKDKSSDRTQSSDKDESTKGAAKESDTSKSDRAAEESKGDTSSGAASGESGRPGPSSAEGRSDTSGKAHVSLSSDQRTRVQSAFKSHRGSAKVDVKIEPRIGVAIPRNVMLFDIPEDVVIIVPEWRRYKYVLIGDEICIVDLDTYEIVEVVAAV